MNWFEMSRLHCPQDHDIVGPNNRERWELDMNLDKSVYDFPATKLDKYSILAFSRRGYTLSIRLIRESDQVKNRFNLYVEVDHLRHGRSILFKNELSLEQVYELIVYGTFSHRIKLNFPKDLVAQLIVEKYPTGYKPC